MYMTKYRPRLVDKVLEDKLRLYGAVLITGPKWCGKTTTATRQSKSVLFMNEPDEKENLINIAKINPSVLFRGKKPRLIDEWQLAPNLWDAARFDVDQSGKNGQYILTGSTMVDWSAVDHSGAGRISRVRMDTLSLYESGDSTGEVSLGELFSGIGMVEGVSEKSLEDIVRIIRRGGWPKSIGIPYADSLDYVAEYCESILDADIKTVDSKVRDPERMRRVLRSLSRNIATSPTKKTLSKDTAMEEETEDDVETGESGKLSRPTLNDYMETLRKIIILDELKAWTPALRSSYTVRTSNTVHFCDPAVACYFLGASDEDLLMNMETLGFLFESLVIRDLRVYAQCLNATVYHYHDSSGLEADAIIHLSAGGWAAIEVKIGEAWVDKAAENLLKLARSTENPPVFLAVVTATKYAYTRPDGVHVIPLACLRD